MTRSRIRVQVASPVAPRGMLPVAETLPQAVEKLVRELDPEKIILFCEQQGILTGFSPNC